MAPERLEVSQQDGRIRTEVFRAGQGEPLLYLHGIVALKGWAPFLDQLSESFTVYAPLLPGYGESRGLEHLDDVIDLTLYCFELLDSLGVQQAHVAGHSLGGMVAAEMAALDHHYVRKLVLVSPMGLWRDDAPATDYLAMSAEDLDMLMWADPNSSPAREAMVAPDSQEARVEVAMDRIKEITAATKFLWPIPDKGLRKRLYRIKSPTLIIWGDQDRIIPPAYAQDFSSHTRVPAWRRWPEGDICLCWSSPRSLSVWWPIS